MKWRVSVIVRKCLILAGVVGCVVAQQKPEPVPTSAQTPGMVSKGGSHAAVLDSKKRPITAGGFADSGPSVFQDISEKAGLTRWRHVVGTPETAFIIETVGSGVALLDYDNDGWLDIYTGERLHVRGTVRQGDSSACSSFS